MNKAIITIMTIVLVVGVCNVPSLYALVWDGGYHEFNAGYESEVDMFNDATADITGGEIGILACWDTTSVFVYEPGEIGLLRPADSSMANVYGGTIYQLFTLGSSTANIYGGLFPNGIDAVDSSLVNLYVESYDVDPTGGRFNDGLITGTWLSSSENFSIELGGADSINHISFIPEPSTIVFFVLGYPIVAFNRRKQQK